MLWCVRKMRYTIEFFFTLLTLGWPDDPDITLGLMVIGGKIVLHPDMSSCMDQVLSLPASLIDTLLALI